MTIKYVNFYSFGLLEYVPSTYETLYKFIRTDDAICTDASIILYTMQYQQISGKKFI